MELLLIQKNLYLICITGTSLIMNAVLLFKFYQFTRKIGYFKDRLNRVQKENQELQQLLFEKEST